MNEVIRWFTENGGRLHSNIEPKSDDDYGLHFIASQELQSDASVAYCPFELTLSYLNCLPNSPEGIRRISSYSSAFLRDEVEPNVVAAFLLVEERQKGENSFWAPYIKLLPKEAELSTPLWFAEDELIWLRGTNLYSANAPPDQTAIGQRNATYMESWKKAISILQSNSIDVRNSFALSLGSYYLSSRSFGSKIITADDRTFSLLYPVLDYFNHQTGAKVEWNMDGGSFDLKLCTSISKRQQVFNNYGPKSNEELLLGYGFCLENNPCDFNLFKMVPAPSHIHRKFREKIPEHFKSETWSAEESRFFLVGSSHYTAGYGAPLGLACLRGFPEALVLATQILLVATMGFEEVNDDGSLNLDIWYATLDTLFHKIEMSRDTIRRFDAELPPHPRSQREKHAKLYRDGQLRILDEIHDELNSFLAPIEEDSTFERWEAKDMFVESKNSTVPVTSSSTRSPRLTDTYFARLKLSTSF